MLNEEQVKYLIDLITQDNKNVLTEISDKQTTPEQKEKLTSRLEISSKVFEKLITEVGQKTHQVSTNQSVLLVDDAKTMRSLISSILVSIGFDDIDTANDGFDAWNMIQQKESGYGLILSDWKMPRMDGLELLQKVRANDATSKSPFIIISGTNNLDQIKVAISAGVTDYMVKPIRPKDLIDKVSTYIKKKK